MGKYRTFDMYLAIPPECADCSLHGFQHRLDKSEDEHNFWIANRLDSETYHVLASFFQSSRLEVLSEQAVVIVMQHTLYLSLSTFSDNEAEVQQSCFVCLAMLAQFNHSNCSVVRRLRDAWKDRQQFAVLTTV